MDPAMIGIILTLLGLIGGFIVFIFKQGKYQGTMENRVNNLEALMQRADAENKCIRDKVEVSDKDAIEYAAMVTSVSSRLEKIEVAISEMSKTLSNLEGKMSKE